MLNNHITGTMKASPGVFFYGFGRVFRIRSVEKPNFPLATNISY